MGLGENAGVLRVFKKKCFFSDKKVDGSKPDAYIPHHSLLRNKHSGKQKANGLNLLARD
jgi:hypothetical protein